MFVDQINKRLDIFVVWENRACLDIRAAALAAVDIRIFTHQIATMNIAVRKQHYSVFMLAQDQSGLFQLRAYYFADLHYVIRCEIRIASVYNVFRF